MHSVSHGIHLSPIYMYPGTSYSSLDSGHDHALRAHSGHYTTAYQDPSEENSPNHATANSFTRAVGQNGGHCFSS